jgi:S1-C subfamily serine protease
MFRSLLLKAASLALALPLLAVACGGSSTAPITPQNLYATSKPGTVLVLADFKAHVTVPDPKLDDNRLEALKNRAVTLVLSGQLPRDQDAIAAWLIDQVLSDPLAYFIPTKTLSQDNVELIGQGSGFVISPDGYVVTNAHVAAPDDTELKQQLAANGLKDFVARDVKDFINSVGSQATPGLVQKATDAITTYDAKYLQIGNLSKSFNIEVGAASSGKVKAQDITAEVLAAGKQIPGKDVAVLKVDRTNMPTVQLGDDSQVNPGDKVYVLGYPGAATFHPVLSEASQTEPTFTSGTISAKKTSPGGFPVFQIDAPITHGNSGGPVFDDHGRVIGIATFGTVDPTSGKEIQGFNFALPISVAREFINKSGAKPREGVVSQKYDEAIALYNKQWYSDALTGFNQVNSLSPGHPYVHEYINKSQTAIAQGKDRSNEKYIPFLVVGIAVVLVLIAGILMLVMLPRRRARAAAGGPMPGGFTPEAAGPAQHSTAGGDPAATAPPTNAEAPPPQLPTQIPAPGPMQGPAPGPTQGPSPGPTQGPTPGQTPGPAPGPGSGPPGPTPGPTPGPMPGPTSGQLPDPGHAPEGHPIGFQPSQRPSAEPAFCTNCGNSVAGKAFCERCGQATNR